MGDKCKTDNAAFAELDGALARYAGKKDYLITALQKAQEIYGYLSGELILHIAEEMNVPPARVYGVATFYAQFRLSPIGKYHILLCQGTACHVNGSGKIEEAVRDELGLGEEQTTDDGLFTLDNVACLGCCSLSPAMMINGVTYGRLTPALIRSVFNEIRANEAAGDKNIKREALV